MNILTKTLLAAVFCVGVATEVSADLVYQNNFDVAGTLADNDVGGASGSFQNSNFALNAADANFSSQYLSNASNPTTGNFTFAYWNATLAGVSLNEVAVFEWDALYLDSDSTVYRTRVRGLDDNGTPTTTNDDSNLTGNVDVTQGNSTAGTVQEYVFVVNSDTSAITLDASLNGQGLTDSIAAGSWELFRDGTSILSGTTSGPANHLALWHQGDNPNDIQSVMYMDNFAVYTNITAVPEPSSLALLGLASLGLIRRRRS